MHWIDWLIFLAPMAIVLWIALRTQRYVRGVADFMAAGRGAGRYLVCTAELMAGLGLISVIATFEMVYKAGFAIGWWSKIGMPVTLLMTLTGFIIYRYRETRVLTMAQFFEARYSRRFRIFAGVLASFSGILNYGVFPAVGARFFVHYCGLPDAVMLGGFAVPTFALLMFILLGAALVFVLMGGQLTILVTDCIQGLLSYGMYLLLAGTILMLFSWRQMSEALMAVPEGKSMLNAFETSKMEDFNLFYVLIGVFGGVYAFMAWQGNQGFNASAVSPHEAKMGRILGAWRGYAVGVMMTLLAIGAFTYLNHPDFATGRAVVDSRLATIDDSYLQQQMRVPVVLSHILPTGIKGVFAALMLFLLLSTDVSYLHSWGSILIQDVVMPLRKKELSPRQHLWLLRGSIAGVALFAFCFGLLFQQREYIFMWFALTGAIYLGGAGSVIIGGLYWKKGTAAGAWSAMIVGSGLAFSAILLQQLWPAHVGPWLTTIFPDSTYLQQHVAKFPINGQVLWLIAILSAIVTYVGVSLLTCRREFDMDWLLHRGRHAVEDKNPKKQAAGPPRSVWARLIGIDDSFTRGDRALSITLFCWSMFWFGVFIVISIWNLTRPWPVRWWASYWHIVGVLMPLCVGAITAVWFTIGGVRDLLRLFAHLRTHHADPQDDGRVQAQGPAAPPAPLAPAPAEAGAARRPRRAALVTAADSQPGDPR